MTEATAVPPTPAGAGLWEDFIDIFHQPSQVFDRRRDGQFGLALLLLVVIMALLYFALNNGIAPIIEAEVAKQAAAIAEKNPAMSADQLTGARGAMEKFAMFGAVVFVPLGVLLGALVLWLVAKFLDAKVAFAAAMMIMTYSQLPRLVELILNALQGLFLDPASITSRYSVQIGPARFLDNDANPFLATLLGGLDLFTIWVCVLVAIGLAVVARVPLKRGAIASAIVWILGLLPALYGALQAG
jgi:hypothetical protein